MKRNLLLVGVLLALLGVTWFVTESPWRPKGNTAEAALKEALASAREIKLPFAELQDVQGVWRLSDGQMARAEFLNELTRSLEQLSFARTLTPSIEEERQFFTQGIAVSLGSFQLTIGDISATGESFYVKLADFPGVQVVDLQEMGSLVTADDDRILQREKYNRLRGLLQLEANGWRERRLNFLTQLGSFSSWHSGVYHLVAEDLKSRPWGESLIKAFTAAVQTLEVQGEVKDKKPQKRSKLSDWVFKRNDGTEVRWEFYHHPDLDLIYVWTEENRAYPLNQASSDLLNEFVPKLIKQPFPLTLWPQHQEPIVLREKSVAWQVSTDRQLKRSFTGEKINDVSADALLDQFTQEQTFDSLMLLDKVDCRRMSAGARFNVDIGVDHWGVLPVKGGLVFLECEAQVALTRSLPLDSTLDFATLQVP